MHNRLDPNDALNLSPIQIMMIMEEAEYIEEQIVCASHSLVELVRRQNPQAAYLFRGLAERALTADYDCAHAERFYDDVMDLEFHL